VRNRVLLTLVLAGGAATSAFGFVGHAANRLVSGKPIALWEAASPGTVAAVGAVGALLLAAALSPQTRALHRAAGAAAASLLILVPFAAGEAARHLAAGAAAAARTSLGAAFWVLLGCAAAALVDALQRLRAGPPARLLATLLVGGALAAMAASGQFDALSLAREYAGRREVFARELGRHCLLVLGAVGPALAVGVPLGIAAARRPALARPLFAALGLVQTVPSIALFGLLIGPLAALGAALPALGVRGVGFAPAAVALTLYSLLPVARNVVAGLGAVDPAVRETAAGMGFTRRQIFWRVELPLGLPVLLAGLRIVTVQAIGLAAVAALVGAGGLGAFVFQGLGQYAVDLVLLGALPIILLALAVDFALRVVGELLARRAAP
jgi:osmoprotectant transport system permease protein